MASDLPDRYAVCVRIAFEGFCAFLGLYKLDLLAYI